MDNNYIALLLDQIKAKLVNFSGTENTGLAERRGEGDWGGWAGPQPLSQKNCHLQITVCPNGKSSVKRLGQLYVQICKEFGKAGLTQH